jgi:hypothetical protein
MNHILHTALQALSADSYERTFKNFKREGKTTRMTESAH